MDICKYCKEHNFTKDEYINFKNNITATAKAIRDQLYYNNGLYYDTNNIIPYNSDLYIKDFLIHELKKLGIEFYDNNRYYRITD